MVEIKIANELLHSAQQGYEKASAYKEQLRKMCQYWCEKEKSHGTVSERSKTVKNFKYFISGIFSVNIF